MTDCEVCMTPTIDCAVVTIDLGYTAPIDIRFCRDCMEALLKMMTERWHGAIEANNAVVGEMMRMLGIVDES